MSRELPPRTPRFSETIMTQHVLPPDTNAVGTAFGGVVMGWIDVCAAIVAQRHTGRIAVTASVDDLEFVAPIELGDVVVLTGRLNQVFRSSMEIEVEVEREHVAMMDRTTAVRARLTFVNLGPDKKPMPVPPLVLETDADRERAAAADERRRERLAKRSSRR